MNYETVLYQKVNHIGSITLNRPEANNAINARLAQELCGICSDINQDENIRVVIITGTEETFSVGAEWSSFPAGSDMEEEAPINEHHGGELWSVASAMADLKCPVIAALNGDALGQGLELALACDLRIAAETARLGLPQINSGLIPWDGGTQRLPRLVGRAKAMEMTLLGKPINAKEAYRIGLVNKVVTLKELPRVVADTAEKMASGAPLALRFAKEAVNKSLDMTLEQGLCLEADLYLLLQTTKDRTEGITGFLGKRQPKFKGE